MSRPMTRAAFVSVLVVFVLTLTACGSVNTHPTSDAAASHAVISRLATASTITIHKSAISLGDHWTVSVDGHTIGQVHGKAASYLDTYSLTTPKGDLVGYEKEDLSFFLHRASVYDEQAQPSGSIDESYHFLFYKETVKDKQGRTVATVNEHVGVTKRGDIYDSHGQVAWKFSKHFLSVGDTYTITRVKGDVPVIDALWSVMIFNEATGKN